MSKKKSGVHLSNNRRFRIHHLFLISAVLLVIAVSIFIGVLAHKYDTVYNSYIGLKAENEALQTLCAENENTIAHLREQIAEYEAIVSKHTKTTQDKQETASPENDTPKGDEVPNDTKNEPDEEPVSEPENNATLMGVNPSALYIFTDSAERDFVERVVMAESGNQSFEGQKAVAQCMVTSVTTSDRTIYEILKQGYAPPYKSEVTQSVKDAVREVFDQGILPVDEPIQFFYSTVGGFVSNWHETSPNLEYVCTIGDHKFFKLKDA